MDWLPALIAAVALLAGTAAVGLWWRSRTGRARSIRDDAAAARGLGLTTETLGTSATLVQFSTAYCSGCPSTARQLASIAGEYPGVRHLEFDLTARPDLADRFRVLQTPTTLILDSRGAATARIGGLPRAHDVRSRLDILTGRTRVPS